MARRHWPLAMFVAAIATPALSAQPQDGWSGYHFGMSPDAVRAVPGITFGAFNPKDLMDHDAGAMASKGMTSIYGQPYSLDLFFDASQKLNGISLQNVKKTSQAACEKNFFAVLGEQEKAYGGFVPVNPRRARNDSETPPMAIVWKAQGASRYDLSTVSLDDETAYVWKSRKSAGGHYVDIATTWAGKGSEIGNECVTAITYG